MRRCRREHRGRDAAAETEQRSRDSCELSSRQDIARNQRSNEREHGHAATAIDQQRRFDRFFGALYCCIIRGSAEFFLVIMGALSGAHAHF
jgi:hypothetical protein